MLKFRSAAIAASFASALVASTALAGAPGTVTTITSQSPNPSTVGASVNLTATVTNPSAAQCFGAIQFLDGGTPLGGAAALTTVDPGSSSVTASRVFPTAGARSVTASYTSTNGCPTSASAAVTQTVNAVAAAVPTVGEWTMWGLAGLIALGGGIVLSRRSRRFV
ncbi:Ig-like domain-containing protein [Brevundimonas variabilis]|uniref:Bacterial Ig-like domain-containing protein n=1 Tax=Brevundimonas variabilis TaxID=74312 RepID=A0A7W9FEJ3_9CAUL|nr:Ig-like domain-containing protein [Brevundimonas variabilis]MBB5746516.1 hypothetical protein [Brevundimonas variabilis]